jgi:hypothetical protein
LASRAASVVDDGNRAHLFSHDHYGEQDLDDILEHNSVLLEADPTKGDADWLLVVNRPASLPWLYHWLHPITGTSGKRGQSVSIRQMAMT